MLRDQAPTVRLEQAGKVLELSPNNSDAEVFEGMVLGSILSTSKPIVELDDIPLLVSWHPGAMLAVWNTDLTNQVGFHRLSVRIAGATYAYDFRTSTAKATWDEVQLMAETCLTSYLGYRRQFTYMAANGITGMVRLPQVHYGWLRERLPEIERLVRSIDHRPATSKVRKSQISLRSKGLDVAQTSRLLRERHHLLECGDGGPIQVAGASYWPSRVVVYADERHSQLEEHVHIAAFLQMLAFQCQDLASIVSPPIRSDVQEFVDLLRALRSLPVFRDIMVRPSARPTSIFRTRIQRSDRRYGRMRDLQAEYGANIADTTDYFRSIRTNVKDAWEVYQTFVAHVIGNSLGLEYASPDKDLRKRSPQGWSMSSAEWRMYFDMKPPRDLLRSWRDETSRPADERPDIILIGMEPTRRVILDVKFKIDSGSGRATPTDLFEMQGYMNSFGVKSGGIIYPGPTPEVRLIAARENALLELSLRASHFQAVGGANAVHCYVRDAVESIST